MSMEVFVVKAGAKGGRRFTLIELLVVIAIIAILAAMLLPALGQAKSHGYKAQCASNEKQLYVMCMNYNNIFNDFFPFYRYRTPTLTWPQTMNVVFYNKNGFLSLKDTLKKTPYICPSVYPRWNDKTSDNYTRRLTSYGCNSSGMSNLQPNASNSHMDKIRKISKVKLTSATILCCDAIANNVGSYTQTNPSKEWGSTTSTNHVGHWHNGSANYLFYDGHYENLKSVPGKGIRRAVSWDGTTITALPK